MDTYMMISLCSAAIYMLLLIGILMIFRKRLAQFVDAFRIRRRLSPDRSKVLRPSWILRHLDQLLRTVMRRPIPGTAFLTLTVVAFFLIFVISVRYLAAMHAALIACAFAAIPYLSLRLRLEKLRRKGSFEGEQLVSAFLTQYWVSEGNIFDTMEQVVRMNSGIRVTGKLLANLLLELRGTGSRERIRKAADAFAYGIGTNWGRLLAYHIRTAVFDGGDIALAIEDILVQLREARALAEERRRINSESVRMVVFLIPVVYIGSVFVSVGLLGVSPLRFFRNQFMTPEGFGLFTLSAFLFVLNIMLLEVMTNRKLDF